MVKWIEEEYKGSYVSLVWLYCLDIIENHKKEGKEKISDDN